MLSAIDKALSGLLLIGWSASYAYIAMERFWTDDNPGCPAPDPGMSGGRRGADRRSQHNKFVCPASGFSNQWRSGLSDVGFDTSETARAVSMPLHSVCEARLPRSAATAMSAGVGRSRAAFVPCGQRARRTAPSTFSAWCKNCQAIPDEIRNG
jgi:hypothetical protein